MNPFPEVAAIITARGGSKGIPGKNIKPMAGKPMIVWTIEAAQQAKLLHSVFVSTEDATIADVCRERGVEVPFMRPPELATDTATHMEVLNYIMHALEMRNELPEYLLTLQPTSPLRTAEDIDAAINLAVQKSADAVIGVAEMERHPFLTKTIAQNGTLQDFFHADLPRAGRRQDMPPAFAINGAIYVNRSAALRCDQTFFPPGAFAYIMPLERSIDVDTPLDFFLAEQLLKQRHAIT